MMGWTPATVRREVRYRFWCPVCRHGSPGAYSTAAECEPWQAMHDRTEYHHNMVAHYFFHALIALDAGSQDGVR